MYGQFSVNSVNLGNIATGAFMKCHEFRIKQPYEERQTVVIIDI